MSGLDFKRLQICTEGKLLVRLTACISIVTMPPAGTGHLPPTPRLPQTLHLMSVLPTLVTGELDRGTLAQSDPCWDS